MAGSDEAHLRRYLAERDTPCPGCGHNLRGLAASACPACRQGLVLRLHVGEGHVGLLIGAVAPLVATAGAAAGVVGFWVTLAVRHEVWLMDMPDGLTLLWCPLLGLLMFGAGAVMLASPHGRRWFRRRTGRRRALIVAAASLAAFLAVAAWVWFASQLP